MRTRPAGSDTPGRAEVRAKSHAGNTIGPASADTLPAIERWHIRAARADDGSYAYVYLPVGQELTVDVPRPGPAVGAWWFDPHDGSSRLLGRQTGRCKLTPLDERDWLLVLEV